jgi:hypothetical protein
LVEEDNDILERKLLRNDLESYCYDMRGNLDSYGKFEKYLDEPTKKTFLEDIGKTVDWIYDAGENASKDEYK